jgi:hypothetical protein
MLCNYSLHVTLLSQIHWKDVHSCVLNPNLSLKFGFVVKIGREGYGFFMLELIMVIPLTSYHTIVKFLIQWCILY